MGSAKKVLPYFEERLSKGKLDYRSKPFYKVFTTACHKDVGRFFNRFKITYFDQEDWLIRIYIDLCTRHDTHAFYYKWYELSDESAGLLDSLHMIPHRMDPPDWTVAAFDLETVPLSGNHIPIGHHPDDRIVMISLFKWNRRQGVRKWLFYLLPETMDDPLPGYEHAFKSESDMLVRFHELLEDAHILTGYNINAFDFPCMFARLLHLRLFHVLRHYRSKNVGTDLVVSYANKMTVDLYSYFKNFSGYDLPSFKLDDVARVKLQGESKLNVKSTGIWSWYKYKNLTRDLFESEDVERCFKILNPETVSQPSEYGTFKTYLDYCLKDSELVYRLFEKEYVLSFLMERANFGALNAVQALHMGNSRYLLELFKTYGMRLGFLVNPKFFRQDDAKKQLLLGSRKTYQGALNYCLSDRHYEDVSVMDFSSMYPSTLLSSNLCYGTCTIMSREEWLSNPSARRLVTIPYREHSNADFEKPLPGGSRFSYPDPKTDRLVIVINPNAEAFLPTFVSHFIRLRQHHQREWKRTQEVYHYNVQLGIKILINSLYGVMASKDSPLAYLVIAISIVTLSRYQLLGSYHYLKRKGYHVCYADTDSLMVHRWPADHCDEVNRFLDLPHVELKYEQRMNKLLVLSKKRYVYQRSDDVVVVKGFAKKISGLVDFMSKKILNGAWRTLFDGSENKFCEGWILWVDTLLEANYLCRDPKRYSIYRKLKNIDEYVSQSCPSVKYLKKYPDRENQHVEFTYGRADVAKSEVSNWVMDVQDCRWVNFEQLFKSQNKIFCMLLNKAYWGLENPYHLANMVINVMHWKRFVHAELLHWHATGRCLMLLVQSGLKYTFTINDHLEEKRRVGRKRKRTTNPKPSKVQNKKYKPHSDPIDNINQSFNQLNYVK